MIFLYLYIVHTFSLWYWLKKWDMLINPAKCNYHTIAREVPQRFWFFPDRSDTPIPVSKLFKGLRVQTGNKFFSSAHCSETANDVKRQIFMIMRSFRDFSKSAFTAVYQAPVRSQLEYGLLACWPNLVANSKIGCLVGNWHSSPPLRKEDAAATTSGWHNNPIQEIHRPIGCGSKFFSPPHLTHLKRVPRQDTKGLRSWGTFLSIKVVKYYTRIYFRRPSMWPLQLIFSRKGWIKFG